MPSVNQLRTQVQQRATRVQNRSQDLASTLDAWHNTFIELATSSNHRVAEGIFRQLIGDYKAQNTPVNHQILVLGELLNLYFPAGASSAKAPASGMAGKKAPAMAGSTSNNS